jgi:choline-glycine betaine transporter
MLREVAGAVLIGVGVLGEAAAVLIAVRLQNKPSRNSLNTTTDSDYSKVLRALIKKLPWMAVMGLATIILGMVLLMNSWPWQVPPTPA